MVFVCYGQHFDSFAFCVENGRFG